MKLSDYYLNNKQYGNRFDTDAQLMDASNDISFGGIMDKQAEFVEKHQLLNAEDWLLFVKQYAGTPDDFDGGWRGEYFGKMMRGACMTYIYTGNEELYSLLFDTCERMLATQDSLGRFSTYSTDCEFNDWDMWCRKYVMLGLLHFHEICRDEEFKERIISALCRHLDYIVEHIGAGNKTDIGKTSVHWGAINSASILEPVIKMYNITGKESYIEFARHIIGYLTDSRIRIITFALEDKIMPYEYPETKAYEMMSCFEGLLEYYRITGEEKCKEAVVRFVDRVKETDISLIGCAGCKHEQFNHTVATQTDTDYTGLMQETCVTVTWMKLCNQLLMLTGDPKYADYIEQSCYNALYGAINNRLNTSNGGFIFDSYSPLTLGTRARGIGGHKDISDTKYYGCCAAIGAAGTALPLITAVTASKSGVVFNYYEEGTVTSGDFEFQIKTAYPTDGRIDVTLLKAPAEEKQIAVRIPGFSGENTRLYICGEQQPIENKGYASLCRHWSKGDKITLDIDMKLRIVRPCGVEGKPNSKNFFAVLYGPIVLARDSQYTAVGETFDLSDSIELIEKNTALDNILLSAKIRLGESVIDMIDYGSAGKTWDENSLTEAWIKCEHTEG